MSKVNNLSLRARLFLGFAAITLLLIISIVKTIMVINPTQEFTKSIIQNTLPSYENIFGLSRNMYQVNAMAYAYILGDNSAREKFINVSNENKKLINLVDSLSAGWSSKEDVAEWQIIKNLFVERQVAIKKFLEANDMPTRQAILIKEEQGNTAKIFDNLDGLMSQNHLRDGGLYDHQAKILMQGLTNVNDELINISYIDYFLLTMCLILSPLIAFYTAKNIIASIRAFRVQSNRIAKGDLTTRVEVNSTDEIGQLGDDLNIMTDNLSVITKQITEACHNMVSTIEEVRRSIEMQSTGASEQASSVNEITASLEEIQKSTMQTTEKAKALGDVADRTRIKGEEGLRAVENSVKGMKAVREKVQTIAHTILDLSHQTQQVGEITAVVNSLAQQSKMLALNASIEAAKAGEAGKGFAVVAAEVKNLAEQSEQSTAQVQKILENIRHATEKAVMVTEEGTKGVDYGTALVEETGASVRNLSDVIHETTIASQQIQAAIKQESIGIDQITAGMNEINQVTSSFVNSVKQTTEAINNLATIAQRLKAHVDVYKS